MSNDVIELLSGVVIGDEQTVSLVELCHCCNLDTEEVFTMVEYGIIEPIVYKSTHIHWEFADDTVLRVKMAQRLQHDLEVNLAGTALVLELMDEIKQLRRVASQR